MGRRSFQAHSLHEDKLFNLIDQQLNNNILDDEARCVIDVALLCVQTLTSRRPLMTHVSHVIIWGGYGGCFKRS
jgi:hypothetical protein